MSEPRFSRQIRLPEVGAAGQERLRRARVLCIGAGGLGSPVALYLAAAGVGTLGIVDDDRVDLSNLQRQVLFSSGDEGAPKATAARTRLLALDPALRVEAHIERFAADNAERLLAGYDLVVDGSDNFETRFLVNDAAYKRGIPLVYAAVNRFEGQVALFDGRHGPCYRCLVPAPPKVPVASCAESGVLGPVVGAVGSLQATLALNQLISAGDASHALRPVIGQLTVLDVAGSWSFSTIQVPKRGGCATCSIEPTKLELRAEAASACAAAARTIAARELKRLLDAGAGGLVLLDVRDDDEWDDGRLPSATHWPLARLEAGELPEFARSAARVVVYCQVGGRSARAQQLMMARGFDAVENLAGGLSQWLRDFPALVTRA